MKPNLISKNNNNRGRQHTLITWPAVMFAVFCLLALVTFAQTTPVQRHSSLPSVTAMTEIPALGEESPAVDEEVLAPGEESPALGEEFPALGEESLVVVESAFCWRDSYGRGVGTIPVNCAPGQDRIGLLCYAKCPANMKRVGFDCHSVCPSGMRDDGLFCRAAEYGRGAGYPWKAGDKLLSLDAARRRCAAANPQGCEKNGEIIYPKCRPGYSPFGCCICRPKAPNCAALGLNPGIDLSCGKKITIGNPVTGSCPGQDKDAGLCYPKCRPGYTGIGPVCWGQPPPGWVKCGMGAARNSKACASVVFGQVASVGQLAITVASLGSSTALTAGMSASQKASRLAKLRQQYSALSVQFELLKKNNTMIQNALDVFRVANASRNGLVAFTTYDNAVTEEDMIRVAAQIAAVVDPTGIADTVGAYTHPKCSKLAYSPTGVMGTSAEVSSVRSVRRSR